MRLILFVLIVLLGCQKKQSEENSIETDTASIEVTPQDAYEKSDSIYVYTDFFGSYDHESNTNGFTAMLTLMQNGNDVYFTASVSQGSCKGEIEGVVMMAEHTQTYYSGFYEADDCRLQFTLNRLEKKIDIKEISLCHLLEQSCSFEGVYLKRIN